MLYTVDAFSKFVANFPVWVSEETDHQELAEQLYAQMTGLTDI